MRSMPSNRPASVSSGERNPRGKRCEPPNWPTCSIEQGRSAILSCSTVSERRSPLRMRWPKRVSHGFNRRSLCIRPLEVVGPFPSPRACRIEDTMWIPFSIEKLPYIELPVSINGIASAAIIDSGARRTILDSAFALRLGLRARPGFKGVGLTGQIFGAYADGLQIQLGDQTLANISAAVLDLSGIAA